MYVYFQSVFRIQNFSIQKVSIFSVCVFSVRSHILKARMHWIILRIDQKYTYIFNQQNVSNSEIVHHRIYVYFWSILRIIQCMRAFRIWDLTENTHTEKMDTFWMLKILNSENWLKIHIHSKSESQFGPLKSFGPVIVIRTPIRKDRRADSPRSPCWLPRGGPCIADS